MVRSCRLAEHLGVDAIHGCEIAQVRQEHRGAHHLSRGGASFFQHSTEVFQHLMCFRRHITVPHHLAGGWIQWNLPGAIEPLAGQHCLVVRPNRCRGVLSGDGLGAHGLVLNSSHHDHRRW